MADEKKIVPKEQSKSQPFCAKKSFKICQNEYTREIKKGDDLSDVPQIYIQNLKTEGVI